MKMIVVMCLVAGSTFAQSAPTATPALAVKTLKSKKPAKPATPPLVIPKEAVDQGGGSFRYVDKKGTAWIYRQSPFGVSRSLESTVIASSGGQTPFGQSKSQSVPVSAPANPSDDSNAKVTAVAIGDLIEFSRPTPFGTTKWQKNKNDLTTDEQKIWARVGPKGNE